MRWREKPLASRVGRRLAIVVVLATLIPLSTFGSIAFTRARQQLDTQASQRLHQDTKAAGLAALDRLTLAEQQLRWLALAGATGSFAQTGRIPTTSAITHVAQMSVDSGRWKPLRGMEIPPESGDAGRPLSLDGRAALVRGREPSEYWLIVGTDGGRAAARLDLAAIFGLGERSLIPEDAVLCVRDRDGQTVMCSSEDARTRAALEHATLPTHGESTIVIAGNEQFVRTWALPLQQDYGAGVWTVVLMGPRAEAYAALRGLARDLSLLTAASLIVVILTVLAAVRRNLRPLSQLERAAAQVSRREFTVDLRIHTRDEFETLADGFNEMVVAVREYVERLETFSVGAATALARTIDAKSPWTSGHSERVTSLAVEIGRAMSLSEDELCVLNRGGLLHDIGKLGTPPEILDKPGRLTDQEMRIMQQHPRDGVRILEPIPTFAPLIPIVLQHHERFDGKGYPDGLRGTEIHLLARVLAVADVFDALRSDRPYRSGLPLSKTVDYIESGAGSHFDPVVVQAFMRVIAAGSEQTETGVAQAV
ncbi:MAG: HD-GYP domain-containing protein [Vicinamibacterales bacterium]